MRKEDMQGKEGGGGEVAASKGEAEGRGEGEGLDWHCANTENVARCPPHNR